MNESEELIALCESKEAVKILDRYNLTLDKVTAYCVDMFNKGKYAIIAYNAGGPASSGRDQGDVATDRVYEKLKKDFEDLDKKRLLDLYLGRESWIPVLEGDGLMLHGHTIILIDHNGTIKAKIT